MHRLLNIHGQQKSNYLGMGIPFARAMIAKGRALTTEESKQTFISFGTSR